MNNKYRPLSQADSQEKAKNFISSFDLIPPDYVIFDGKIRYVPVNGKSSNDKTGRYVGHDNGYCKVLLCCNWAQDMGKMKKLIITNGKQPSPTEQKAFRRKIEKSKLKFKEEIEKKYGKQAEYAQRVYDRKVTPANPNHPYLKKKGIFPYGAMQKGPSLLIFGRDINGKIWTYQSINAQGEKRFLKDSRKTGTFHRIQGKRENQYLFFCEGFATGVSLHQATNSAVYICFDAKNMIKVIEEVAKKYGNKYALVICGDDDAYTNEWSENGKTKMGKYPPKEVRARKVKRKDNPGREAAKTAAALVKKITNKRPKVILPQFRKPGPEKSDFNDLYQEQGLAEVKRQIERGTVHSIFKKSFAEEESTEDLFEEIPRFEKKFVHIKIYEACMDYAKAYGVEVEIPVFTLLTTVGACIGTTKCIEIKNGWREFPNLYMCMIGMSGTGKTPCQNAIQKAVIEKENDWATEYNMAMERYEQEELNSLSQSKGPPIKKPSRKEFILSDTTPEAMEDCLINNSRGMLFNTDELTWLFHNMGRYSHSAEGQKSRLLGAYDSRFIKVNRKSEKRAKFTQNACLSIYGNIPPSIMKDIFSAKDAHSGLIPRFQFVTLKNSGPPKISIHTYSIENSDIIRIVINSPLGYQHDKDGNPGVVKVQPGAFSVFEKWANGIQETYYYSDKNEIYLPMARKMVARVLRFSLIDHCITFSLAEYDKGLEDYQITTDAMARMTAFGDYLMKHQVNVWEKYLNGSTIIQEKPIQLLVINAVITLYPKESQGEVPLSIKAITNTVNNEIRNGRNKGDIVNSIVIGRILSSLNLKKFNRASIGGRGVLITQKDLLKLKRMLPKTIHSENR